MRHLSFFFIVASVICTSIVACGSSSERSSFETTTRSPNDPGAGPGGPGGSDGPGQPAGPGGILGSGGDDPSSGPDGGGNTCAATVSQATRAAVDIIVVIDTSGSMADEIQQVQDNINDFAQSVANTGLDYNVIMIAHKPARFWLGICVPPPLGGADCSDNPPTFHHLNRDVESTDSLKIILDAYKDYVGWLRPAAYKAFIEVTDDNSKLAYDAFDTQLLQLDPVQFGTPTNRRYIFNSICGYKRNTTPLSAEKCKTSENTGDQYQRLSQLTGGVIDSVCEKSYASIFDNIGKGLIQRLGCEFAFPKSESGKATDPTTVAVTYTPGDGSAKRSLTRVTDANKCDGTPDGWYYDDPQNPTKILFCPSTCSGPGADMAGKVEVAVGCKTVGPK